MNKDKNKITIKAYWYKHTVAKLNYCNKQLRLNIFITAATKYEGNLKISIFIIFNNIFLFKQFIKIYIIYFL